MNAKVAVVALVAAALPGTPPAAAATADEGEARARVACAGGRAELRVEPRRENGVALLRVEVRVDVPRPVRRWRVTVLHERSLVVSGVRRGDRSGRRLRVRLRVPDWPGRETVTARLAAPDGRSCRLGVTV